MSLVGWALRLVSDKLMSSSIIPNSVSSSCARSGTSHRRTRNFSACKINTVLLVPLDLDKS